MTLPSAFPSQAYEISTKTHHDINHWLTKVYQKLKDYLTQETENCFCIMFSLKWNLGVIRNFRVRVHACVRLRFEQT